MRLPNGYGSVFKLKGNRRRPWIARKTTGWNEKAQPIYYVVGYYETKQEALSALGAFNMNPTYTQNMTLNEVYEKWAEEKYKTVSKSLKASYSSSWGVLAPLHNVDINAIKLKDYQMVFDRSDRGPTILRFAKIVLGQVYQYAEKYEIVAPDKIKFKYLEVKREAPKRKKTAFTPEEVNAVWESSMPFRDYVLILLYTGMRVRELLTLRKEDVDLETQCIHVRESKTAAGVRDIPIHPRIMFLMEKYEPYPFEYTHFREKFMQLCPNHTIHETRHTFVTRLVEAGVDPRLVKKLAGHSSNDVTDIYTHVSLPVLAKAIAELP